MEVSSNEKVVALFQGFMEYLKDKYNSIISNEQEGEKIVIDGFDEWCQKGNFFEQVKSLFEIKKYSISNKEKYQFLKYALMEGHSNRYGDAYLLSPEMIPLVDFEYISTLLQNSLYKEIGHILSHTNNLDLVNSLRNTDGYKQNRRRIVRQIILPEDLNYQGEVPSNKTIDIFNQMYDDTCLNERKAFRLLELLKDRSQYHIRSINYLNQNNLMSLMDTLHHYRKLSNILISDLANKIYAIIQQRKSDGTLTLYDYDSFDLRHLKQHIGDKLSIGNAPYTNYILKQFQDLKNNSEMLDAKFKSLIHINFKDSRIKM